MGQTAVQAQNTQLTPMPNPKQQMMNLLEKSWPRIMSVIGNNLSPQRLYQMYVSTINREPQLAQCSVESVLSCFMKCAALGLEPSNVDGLGRAYILPYGNKNLRTGQKEATFIIGYRGLIDLARRSGQIRDISARAVHEGDTFEYAYGLDETLHHVPCAKPGKLTHVYMVAHFTDGGHYMLVMTDQEIRQVMQRSPSARKQNSPWHTDYEAMAKKTVIRRAAPYLPMNVEAQQAAAGDERTPDYSDVFHPLPDAIDTTESEPQPDATVDIDEPMDSTDVGDGEASPLTEMIRRFQQIGVASDAQACETISRIIGRTVTSTSELTPDEITSVLADLKAGMKEE